MEYTEEEKKHILRSFYSLNQQTFLDCIALGELLRWIKQLIRENDSSTETDKKEDDACCICKTKERIFKDLWKFVFSNSQEAKDGSEYNQLAAYLWKDLNVTETEILESPKSKATLEDIRKELKEEARKFMVEFQCDFSLDSTEDSPLKLHRKIFSEYCLQGYDFFRVEESSGSAIPTNCCFHPMTAGIHSESPLNFTSNGVSVAFLPSSQTSLVVFQVCMGCYKLHASGQMSTTFHFTEWSNYAKDKFRTMAGCEKQALGSCTPKEPIRIKKEPKKNVQNSFSPKKLTLLNGGAADVVTPVPPQVIRFKKVNILKPPLSTLKDKEKNEILGAVNLKRKTDGSENVRKSSRNRKASKRYLGQFQYDDSDEEATNTDEIEYKPVVKKPTLPRTISSTSKPPPLVNILSRSCESPELKTLNNNLLTLSVNKAMDQKPITSTLSQFSRAKQLFANHKLQAQKIPPAMGQLKKFIQLVPCSQAKATTTSPGNRIVLLKASSNGITTPTGSDIPKPIRITPLKKGAEITQTNKGPILFSPGTTGMRRNITLIPINLSGAGGSLRFPNLQNKSIIIKPISNKSPEKKNHQQFPQQTFLPMFVKREPSFVKSRPSTDELSKFMQCESLSPPNSPKPTTIHILTDLAPEDRSPLKRKKERPIVNKTMSEIVSEFIQSVIYDEEEAKQASTSTPCKQNEIPVPYEAHYLCISETIDVSGWKAYWFRRCRVAKIKEGKPASDDEEFEKYRPTASELKQWVKGESPNQKECPSLKSKLIRNKEGNWMLSRNRDYSPTKSEDEHKNETREQRVEKFNKDMERFISANKNAPKESLNRVKAACAKQFDKFNQGSRKFITSENSTFIFGQHSDLSFCDSIETVVRPNPICYKDFSYFKSASKHKLRRLNKGHYKLLMNGVKSHKRQTTRLSSIDLPFSMISSHDLPLSKRRKISVDKPSPISFSRRSSVDSIKHTIVPMPSTPVTPKIKTSQCSSLGKTTPKSVRLKYKLNLSKYAGKIIHNTVPQDFVSDIYTELDSLWRDTNIRKMNKKKLSTYSSESFKPLSKNSTLVILTKEDVLKALSAYTVMSPRLSLNKHAYGLSGNHEEVREKMEKLNNNDLQTLISQLENELNEDDLDNSREESPTAFAAKTKNTQKSKPNGSNPLCNYGTVIAVAKDIVVNKSVKAYDKIKENCTTTQCSGSTATNGRPKAEKSKQTKSSNQISEPYICQSSLYSKDFYFTLLPPLKIQEPERDEECVDYSTTKDEDLPDIFEISETVEAKEQSVKNLLAAIEDDDEWEYDTDSESYGISSEECGDGVVEIPEEIRNQDVINVISDDEDDDVVCLGEIGDEDSVNGDDTFENSHLDNSTKDGSDNTDEKENEATVNNNGSHKQNVVVREGNHSPVLHKRKSKRIVAKKNSKSPKQPVSKLEDLRKEVFENIKNKDTPQSKDETNGLQDDNGGYRAVFHSSPRLRRIRERFSTNGSYISQLIKADE